MARNMLSVNAARAIPVPTLELAFGMGCALGGYNILGTWCPAGRLTSKTGRAPSPQNVPKISGALLYPTWRDVGTGQTPLPNPPTPVAGQTLNIT